MKNILFILLICFVCKISVTSTSSCSNHFTCGNCAAYKDCYWCPSTNKCEDYYGEKFANLICPGKWIQHDSLCSEKNNKNGADSALFKLLSSNLNQANNENPLQLLLSGNPASSSQSGGGSASSQELKDLLHKLLLLKLLRKIKAEGTGSLTAEESKMLSQLSSYRQQGNHNKVATTTTSTTTTKTPDMSNEIKQLLSILGKSQQEATTSIPKTTTLSVANKIATRSKVAITPLKVTNAPEPQSANETVMSLLKKIDEQNAGVEYQENQPVESLGGPDKNSKALSKPTTSTTKTSTVLTTTSTSFSKSNGYTGTNYCKLYEETELCNSDHNCTWCNTKDICIRRSDNDYQGCVAAKDNLKDKEFGLDTCLARTQCKQCVENDKCYWCDVSKSCHTYPFFGYIPHSCGGDWYVKQCDVQLAVIIIVLPLIIILLAMVTFYFCLKYCYYRRKVLRVPLFERPGVFDYRKDKKVYYVNPEDESSDTEMAAEKIRKKYRLPMEREPLIDPNS